MATSYAKIYRNGPTTEAALDALLVPRQWGYADDTRRISVMEAGGTIRRYYDATRFADLTGTYGTALIGSPGITGITPSGGTSGATGTLKAMLTGFGSSVILKSPYSSAINTVQPIADYIALTIKGYASQTVDLQQWVTAAGTVKARLGVAGDLDLASDLNVTGNQVTTGTLGIAGLVTMARSTATTAGGAVGAKFGSSGVTGLYFGSGAPSVTAPKGALYLRTDGSATNNRAYINSDGGTTWTALTTAA